METEAGFIVESEQLARPDQGVRMKDLVHVRYRDKQTKTWNQRR